MQNVSIPKQLRELHLFAGAGGGILGGMLLGHTCVCAVEIEPYCREVLLQRQRDRILPKFPLWDDVRTFNGKPWRGLVDVVCGGFPCQDISAAGKGAGINGERSGLWKEMARIIGEIQPRFVFIENSPLLRKRGLNVVLKDLAEMGYNARWGVLGAHNVGAPHKRDRMWILANSNMHGGSDVQRIKCGVAELNEPCISGSLLDNADGKGLQGAYKQPENQRVWRNTPRSSEGKDGWWTTEPSVGRVVDGMANRTNRLKALGNGQVPLVAATAWSILSK